MAGRDNKGLEGCEIDKIKTVRADNQDRSSLRTVGGSNTLRINLSLVELYLGSSFVPSLYQPRSLG
ncbi:hypothetical protein OFO11_24640, partial [Escherichia coli]|nr:hypothetical protein [Escherichia coli]